MRRFDASPRRATPKGHNLHHLHSTASRSSTYIRTSLCARGALKINFTTRLALGAQGSPLNAELTVPAIAWDLLAWVAPVSPRWHRGCLRTGNFAASLSPLS